MPVVGYCYQQILLDNSQHVKQGKQIPEDPVMQIAIIGAGNVGRALAGSLIRAGHDVTVSAAHEEHAQDAATQTGARAAASNQDAVSGAELVVLAVPATAFDELAAEIGGALTGKVVVDVSNRPTPSADGPGTSIAEELQVKLPGTSVIKAFNTAFASRQANPQVAGISPDGFVAGDDATAKQTVLDVVESIGFRPVDAGSLAAARTLEGMAWLNISRNIAGGTWQDAWVLVGPELTGTAAENRN
jgi:predicted dinucleotide-binding enzyme